MLQHPGAGRDHNLCVERVQIQLTSMWIPSINPNCSLWALPWFKRFTNKKADLLWLIKFHPTNGNCTWWWKSISSSNWMPQNSHGMIMLPSVFTACCCSGYVDLQLCSCSKKSLTCMSYSCCWLGEELLLLNEAKALAGLQPVCYVGNIGKKVLVIFSTWRLCKPC